MGLWDDFKCESKYAWDPSSVSKLILCVKCDFKIVGELPQRQQVLKCDRFSGSLAFVTLVISVSFIVRCIAQESLDWLRVIHVKYTSANGLHRALDTPTFKYFPLQQLLYISVKWKIWKKYFVYHSVVSFSDITISTWIKQSTFSLPDAMNLGTKEQTCSLNHWLASITN